MSERLFEVISHCIQVKRRDRPQSIDEFFALLDQKQQANSEHEQDTQYIYDNEHNETSTETIYNHNIYYDTKTIAVNGVAFKMVKVKGGTFQMGATTEQGSEAEKDEKPVHTVILSDYYIGQTEVTQELWQAVMGDNPAFFKGDSQRPVENVSWEDCQEFIQKLNRLTGLKFRLPTEAEWEFAARGGVKSKGYKYSGSNDADAVAWYGENSGSKTHPVATKQSNELGLYDMSGNVREWCYDWYGPYSGSAQTNPKGPSIGSCRILRGGSWNSIARFVRSYYRSITPTRRNNDYGLRLAI
ncbi:MAG TPA: formylglycine-generating enzyme family protein [Candidatus Onthomorpha intestinigallinarum]|uniref:Formylglycine-generating enzyme family protein n=1 Tax=Candidatus Onthomorpha intestinigallinarum TaxID=2840880 RepID=A0A9D1RGK5_9BACT|nr:formylglycine-generating enzyme family protein [Candidatus Onthomorpha intestinigallinarum]